MPDGGGAGRHGENQSGGSDGVGRGDEQHTQCGGRGDIGRIDILLNKPPINNTDRYSLLEAYESFHHQGQMREDFG